MKKVIIIIPIFAVLLCSCAVHKPIEKSVTVGQLVSGESYDSVWHKSLSTFNELKIPIRSASNGRIRSKRLPLEVAFWRLVVDVYQANEGMTAVAVRTELYCPRKISIDWISLMIDVANFTFVAYNVAKSDSTSDHKSVKSSKKKKGSKTKSKGGLSSAKTISAATLAVVAEVLGDLDKIEVKKNRSGNGLLDDKRIDTPATQLKDKQKEEVRRELAKALSRAQLATILLAEKLGQRIDYNELSSTDGIGE
ncbi:MAG: hypothetical protein HY606_02470 [Planctomycetes bacterium]|nr:hypothetical protein [Planctomycetota bacterium]